MCGATLQIQNRPVCGMGGSVEFEDGLCFLSPFTDAILWTVKPFGVSPHCPYLIRIIKFKMTVWLLSTSWFIVRNVACSAKLKLSFFKTYKLQLDAIWQNLSAWSMSKQILMLSEENPAKSWKVYVFSYWNQIHQIPTYFILYQYTWL